MGNWLPWETVAIGDGCHVKVVAVGTSFPGRPLPRETVAEGIGCHGEVVATGVGVAMGRWLPRGPVALADRCHGNRLPWGGDSRGSRSLGDGGFPGWWWGKCPAPFPRHRRGGGGVSVVHGPADTTPPGGRAGAGREGLNTERCKDVPAALIPPPAQPRPPRHGLNPAGDGGTLRAPTPPPPRYHWGGRGGGVNPNLWPPLKPHRATAGVLPPPPAAAPPAPAAPPAELGGDSDTERGMGGWGCPSLPTDLPSPPPILNSRDLGERGVGGPGP